MVQIQEMTIPKFRDDANGNMISDQNKNISSIDYNHFNLPQKVTFSDGNSMESRSFGMMRWEQNCQKSYTIAMEL